MAALPESDKKIKALEMEPVAMEERFSQVVFPTYEYTICTFCVFCELCDNESSECCSTLFFSEVVLLKEM